MKSIIVAVDKNMGIGVDNHLLWGNDLPDDIAYYNSKTRGASVIMGWNTLQSMGGPLPERENIVVSREPSKMHGVLTATDLSSAYELARYPIFVIGGGHIYADAIQDMDRLYVTEVHASFAQATVFFPRIDATEWREISRIAHSKDERNKYAFDFVVYERK